MARTVKQEEYTARRNEILNVAQRLVYTVGYDQLAIQDILDELHISKGAFYHYFSSKQALLEALIEYLYEQVEPLLIPIVEDPDLPALDKLHCFFDVAARWKTAHKTQMLSLMRVWYADENAIVRHKAMVMMIKKAGPLLAGVVAQGVREGVLTARFPERASEIVFNLSQSIGDDLIELLWHCEQTGLWREDLERAADLIAAYTDAIERVLGAPEGSLNLLSKEILQEWFAPPDSAPLLKPP